MPDTPGLLLVSDHRELRILALAHSQAGEVQLKSHFMVMFVVVTLGFISVAQAGGPDAGVVGWRSDGLGRYPDATPPTEWGPDTNVVWKTELDGFTNAMPVVLDDCVIVMAEPDKIVCVNKADGAIRWTQSVPLASAMTEADKAELPALKAKAAELRKKIGGLTGQRNQAWKDRGALAKEIDAAKKAKQEPDPAKVKQVEELGQKFKDLSGEINDLNMELAVCQKWDQPPARSETGYTSPTPVSDGKQVWACLGSGLLVCYDLQGNRKWAVNVARPPDSRGFSTSPSIADGKVLVHYRNLQAFDAATGKLLWTAEGTKGGWGSPTVARVDDVPVAVTAAGDVVALADGKVLAHMWGQTNSSTPIVVDGVCYDMGDAAASAFKLSAGENGGVKAEKLWSTYVGSFRVVAYSSPQLLDGLLYGIKQDNTLFVFDAASGKILNGEGKGAKLDQLGKGIDYASVTLAGKYLYLGSDNGTIVVLRPGQSPEVVATNKLDGFRTTPIFEGKRMYLRTYKYLYCIGQ